MLNIIFKSMIYRAEIWNQRKKREIESIQKNIKKNVSIENMYIGIFNKKENQDE